MADVAPSAAEPTLALDEGTLARVLRAAFGAPEVEVNEWHAQPLAASLGGATGGLYRLAGTAAQGAGNQLTQRPWSVVLKIVRLRAHDGPEAHAADSQYWRREVCAYESGLLRALPGGLAAPQCYGVHEQPDGSVWLWLEDVREEIGRAWPVARYALAARHLGHLNGAYLANRPLPNDEWLSRFWLRGWVGRGARYRDGTFIQREDAWTPPLVRRALGPPDALVINRILRMWAAHAALHRALDLLPRTLSHLDANRTNLLARHHRGVDETVAVDWAFVGHGGVGEDIGQLAGSSLMRLQIDAAQARDLGEAVFDGYLEGLREAGWHGDPALARLGYAAHMVLRWGFAPGLALAVGRDEAMQRLWEQRLGHPIESCLLQWAALTHYLLDLAEEARALAA